MEIESGLDDATLCSRYSQAAVVAVTAHHEPFGLVPLEAMACETPVIGVAEGGLCESIEDGVTGLLVPRNPEAVAIALDTLLNDPSLCRSMGGAGRAAVIDRWGWQRTAACLERQLQQAIEDG